MQRTQIYLSERERQGLQALALLSGRSQSALLVVDTDVVIDYLRDKEDAVAFLEGFPNALALSVVSVEELYAGVREGEERRRLDAFVTAFDCLPVERQAAVQAGL